jgi:hypothetical protein
LRGNNRFLEGVDVIVKHRYYVLGVIMIPITGLVLVFQNCGGSFKPLEQSLSSESSSVSQDMNLNTPTLAPTNNGSEVLPLFAESLSGQDWLNSPPFSITPPGRNSIGTGLHDVFPSFMFASPEGLAGVVSACGSFVSQDHGRSFSQFDTSQIFGTIRSVAADQGVVFVGSDYGLFRSRDGGKTFTQVLNSKIAEDAIKGMFPCTGVGGSKYLTVRKISVHRGRLILSTTAGMLVSQDGGDTYSGVQVFHEGYLMAPLSAHSFYQDDEKILLQITFILRPMPYVFPVAEPPVAALCARFRLGKHVT